MKTLPVLILFALLLTGCNLLPQRHALMDPTIPHRVAHPVSVDIFVRLPGGDYLIERVTVPAGAWIANPEALTPARE